MLAGLLFAAVACAPTRPIRLLELESAPEGMPPSSTIVFTEDIDPFPSATLTAASKERIRMHLISDEGFKGDKLLLLEYTLFDKSAGTEGTVNFIPEPWRSDWLPRYFYAPEAPGIYELRIYFEGVKVGAASFDVR